MLLMLLLEDVVRGLATYLHLDWWRSVAPSNARLKGLPDSGFFLDYDAPSGQPHYSTDMKWVFMQQNATVGVNSNCIQAHISTKDTYKCFFAEHTSPHIDTPFLPLQSEYDSWQTANILGSSNAGAINTYGQMFSKRFKDAVLSDAKNGAFLDSCFHHCAGWSLTINGKTGPIVFDPWFRSGANGVDTDSKAYPCTECCKQAELDEEYLFQQ